MPAGLVIVGKLFLIVFSLHHELVSRGLDWLGRASVHSLPRTGDAASALRSAAVMANNFLSARCVWRIDGGDQPNATAHRISAATIFFFRNADSAEDRGNWECVGGPALSISLVAFTQSSTFGPTDAPLLARWAKVLAMIQIFISLSIVVLLISRAIGAL